jgi:glycosyltransferase involved in cell wall biosynthesis
MTHGRVVIDLVAAQSPSYRERGIARHSIDFTAAMLARHPELIERVLLHPELPPAGGMEDVVASGKAVGTPDWPGIGGVFHATSAFEPEVPIRALWPRLASIRRMRLVVTVYDLIPDIFPELYLVDPGLRTRWRACRELVRVADHIFTLSRSGRADVVERLGVPEDRVTVIGAACSDRFHPPASRQDALAVAQAGVLGLGRHFVVCNGAIDPRKNIDRLLQAYAKLPASIRERWQLVLVCRIDPLQRNHYEIEAGRLGIGGELLLTGYVDDRTLVTLYQAADLAMFPSLYEGYGLPVIEALACGAPVIASDNSSLRELVIPDGRFDPFDTDAMASAMTAALTDNGLRDRLLAETARPGPTWDDVVDRAAEVYEQLLRRDARVGAAGRLTGISPGWRRRPLFAVVTPWPPAATDAAVWASRLVAALAEGVEVDRYVETGQDPPTLADDADSGAEHPPRDDPLVLPALLLPKFEAWRGGYDAVIICLDDTRFHVGGLRLLRAGRPAVVVAYSLRLLELYHWADVQGAPPEGFPAALHHLYPGLGAGGTLSPAPADQREILMAREVIGASERFLVMFDHTAGLARRDARPEHADRIGVLPFACPPPPPASRRQEQLGLVCGFGPVTKTAALERLLGAFAVVARRRPDARLVLIGPAGEEERAGVGSLADELGIGDRVAITGWLDQRGREEWLSRCCVAVPLQERPDLDAPLALGDCLAWSLPTVVADGGTLAELDGFVASVPTGADAESLAVVLAELLDDRPRRLRLGAAARAFAEANTFDRAADRLHSIVLGRATAGS